MASFQIRELIDPEKPVTSIAANRKAAALLAIALPILVTGILAAALAKHSFDLESMLRNRPVLRVTLLPGLVALCWWIARYWSSAAYALITREDPVTVTENQVAFFGSSYPLETASSLKVQKGKIRLMNDDLIISQRPLFFIKSKQLEINLNNLG